MNRHVPTGSVPLAIALSAVAALVLVAACVGSISTPQPARDATSASPGGASLGPSAPVPSSGTGDAGSGVGGSTGPAGSGIAPAGSVVAVSPATTVPRATPVPRPAPGAIPSPTARPLPTSTLPPLPFTGAGVVGRAMLGPTCPVQRDPPDPACADKPLPGAVLVVETTTGAEVARGSTNAQGYFAIELNPGSYVLVPEAFAGAMHAPAAISFEARASGPTMVNVSYDTGIR